MITKDDHIVTAYAESASGPGWANAPVWVVVKDIDGKLRIECLQPNEQSAEIYSLYEISQATHSAMVSAVKSLPKRRVKQ